MATRTVEVRLLARVGQYIAAVQAAQAATLGMANVTQSQLTKVGSQMQSVGRKMSLFVTVPIVAAGAASVKAAMDWESSWAGVDKTVEGTTEQMAALEQGIRDMAKTLPATHTEIAHVAQVAGALGVQTPNILGFTRVMIDLGEATDDLSADEAATEIAQLMNIMQTAPDDVDNLGAALVDLGNNGASTEGQILNMAHRIAGAAQVVGMSEQDVLGLANAMASLGIEAELGGSAISRTMVEINRSVSMGGEKLRLFSETAGMSAQEFARVWQTDPTAALVAFIDGLARLDASGGNVDLLLKDLSLNGLRVSDTLKRLMGSGDLLTESLDRSNRAWDENVALTNEAERRYATTASQFEVVRNRIVDLAIDLGQILLPIVEFAVQAAGDLAGAFQSLPQPVQMAVLAFGGLLAAVGPLVLLGGSLVKNFTYLKGALMLLGGPLGGLSMGMLAFSAAAAIGFAAWQGFTQEEREAEEATRNTVAALNTQFPALIAAAVAASEAGVSVDGLTVAYQALTAALAEGEQDAVRALANFNMSADDLLGVMVGLERGGIRAGQTMQTMARNFGLTAEQAGHFVRLAGEMSWDDMADNASEVADAIGITEDQLAGLVAAFFAFEQASASVDLEDITTEFLRGRVAAMGYEDSMVKAAEAAAGVTRLEEDPVAVYNALTQELLNATDAERELAGITPEVEAQIAAITGLLPETAAGFEDAAFGMEGMADAGIAAADAFAELQRIASGRWMDEIAKLAGLGSGAHNMDPIYGMADAITRYGEALHMVSDPQRNFIRSQDAIWEAGGQLLELTDENTRSLAQNTDEGRENRAMLMDWMDSILAGADAQIAAGDSIEDVNQTLGFNVKAMRDAALAAGFNEDEVDDLIDAYMNVPETVATAIKMSGEMYALARIEEMLEGMGEIDAGVVAEMEAILLTQGAWSAYRFLYDTINNSRPTVRVRVQVPRVRVYTTSNGSVAVGHMGYAVVAKKGAYVGNVGEGGVSALLHSNEVVLPLNDPARMSALLGLPQVGPKVAAAMTSWLPMRGGVGGGGGTTVIQNNYITLHNPDGPSVLRALQDLARQRGPLPIRIAA